MKSLEQPNIKNSMLESDIRTVVKAMRSFGYFTRKIFSKSFERFIYGKHVDDTCDYLEQNRWTMRISARDHFKSTSLYAKMMHIMLQNLDTNVEMHYFSYNKSLASYHLGKTKELIKFNPYFNSIIDLKKTSEGIMKYSWDGIHSISVQPHGLLSFIRGVHGPYIFVDDPFQDPDNKLNPTKLNKINRIVRTQIPNIITKGGELHIVGTAQSKDDFFFDPDFSHEFATKIMPAIKDEQNKITLWPEYKNYADLMRLKRTIGEKYFNQEMMCIPAWSEDSFFKREQLIINKELSNLKSLETENDVWLGWDIGGKVHPSHVCIFEATEKGIMQRLSLWMDKNYPLTHQLNKVNELCNSFSVSKGMFDYTREELKTSLEQGKVDSRLIPFKFSEKSKNTIAQDFDKEVTAKNIQFIDDRRQINQMLVVDNNLVALESQEGHGDSFWSIAMAVHCSKVFGGKGSMLLDSKGYF